MSIFVVIKGRQYEHSAICKSNRPHSIEIFLFLRWMQVRVKIVRVFNYCLGGQQWLSVSSHFTGNDSYGMGCCYPFRLGVRLISKDASKRIGARASKGLLLNENADC
jgi:hypothetical protein